MYLAFLQDTGGYSSRINQIMRAVSWQGQPTKRGIQEDRGIPQGGAPVR